jgi:hypothetical protein
LRRVTIRKFSGYLEVGPLSNTPSISIIAGNLPVTTGTYPTRLAAAASMA